MRQNIDIQALMRRALAAGYTTASLARAVGLSQPSVSRLASGKTKPPKSMQVMANLVRVVGGEIVIPDDETDEHAEKAARHAA